MNNIIENAVNLKKEHPEIWNIAYRMTEQLNLTKWDNTGTKIQNIYSAKRCRDMSILKKVTDRLSKTDSAVWIAGLLIEWDNSRYFAHTIPEVSDIDNSHDDWAMAAMVKTYRKVRNQMRKDGCGKDEFPSWKRFMAEYNRYI